MLQHYSAFSGTRLAIHFFVGHNCLQVSSCSSDVLRGFTYHPPSSHASGMAIRPLAILHLISVRTDSVRTECYYILCAKASKPQHLDGECKIRRK